MGHIVVVRMLPFFLSVGTHLSVSDAFFETMSGFTTTGASVLNTLIGIPKSILAWRCVVQWVGGLGIILLRWQLCQCLIIREACSFSMQRLQA